MRNEELKNRFEDYYDFKLKQLKNETDKYFADKCGNELVGYITSALHLNFITRDEWQMYNGEIQDVWFDAVMKIMHKKVI
jgi:hypothetical protein